MWGQGVQNRVYGVGDKGVQNRVGIRGVYGAWGGVKSMWSGMGGMDMLITSCRRWIPMCCHSDRAGAGMAGMQGARQGTVTH